MTAITVFVKKHSVACHCSQDTMAGKCPSMLIVAMLFVGSFCLVSNVIISCYTIPDHEYQAIPRGAFY